MLLPPSKKRSIMFTTNCAPCSKFVDLCSAEICDKMFSGVTSSHRTSVLYVSQFFARISLELLQTAMLQAAKRGCETAFNLGSTDLDDVALKAICLSTIVIGNACEWGALGLAMGLKTENYLKIVDTLPPIRGGRIAVITNGDGTTLVVDRMALPRKYTPPAGANVVDTTGATTALVSSLSSFFAVLIYSLTEQGPGMLLLVAFCVESF